MATIEVKETMAVCGKCWHYWPRSERCIIERTVTDWLGVNRKKTEFNDPEKKNADNNCEDFKEMRGLLGWIIWILRWGED